LTYNTVTVSLDRWTDRQREKPLRNEKEYERKREKGQTEKVMQ